MSAYFITLFLAITFSFILFRLIPGNPIKAYIGELIYHGRLLVEAKRVDELIQEYEKMFGLEGDLFTQYINFWKEILRFNLGPSLISFPTPAKELIIFRLPWTIGLLGISTLISWILGVSIGALVGWKRESKLDRMLTSVCVVLSQVPYYLLAVLLILIFSYILMWLPSSGGFDPRFNPGNLAPEQILDFIKSVITHGLLPSFSIILTSICGWILSTRFLMISVLGEDYLRFAEAKGLKPSRIFKRYTLKNVLLPQITGLGMSLGFITNGSVVLETVFRYPGIGSLFSTAVSYLDYNLIMGILIIMVFTVLTATLILDFIYPLIDPRVKFTPR
jgi:peptide/nickel transport system permease protein